MKKLFGLIIFGFALFPGVLRAVDGDPRKPAIWSVGNRSVGVDTKAVTVDYEGNILPGRNLAQDLGESTHAFKTGYFGQVDVASGLLNVAQFWDAPNSSAAAGYGQFTVSTTTLVNSGTTYAAWDLSQSTIPRTLVIHSSFTVGMSTTVTICTATVVGIDSLGRSVSEIVYFSTAAAETNRAWAYVSSITINSSSVSITGEANVVFKVGTGNKFGLSNSVETSSDVYKIATGTGTINLTDSGVSVDTTYDTIFFGQNIPNSVRKFWAWFRVRRSIP